MLLGKFECEIAGHRLTVSSNGNHQVEFDLNVLFKLNADGTREAVEGGVRRKKWMTLTDKTIDRFAEDLAFVGFTGSPAQLDPSHNQHVSLIGKISPWFSSKSSYNGKDREEWNVDRPRAAQAPKAIDQHTLMEADALWGDKFKSSQTSYGGSQGTAPPTDPGDAPF